VLAAQVKAVEAVKAAEVVQALVAAEESSNNFVARLDKVVVQGPGGSRKVTAQYGAHMESQMDLLRF
jgi:hypothetical protein